MHALIIEDMGMIAFMVEEDLREIGFTGFTYADSYASALAAVEKRWPDLIVADVELVDGPATGVAAVDAICASKSVPTVYLTGHPDHPALAGRPQTVVGKPFTDHGLKSALRQALADAGLADAIAAPGTAPVATLTKVLPSNLSLI